MRSVVGKSEVVVQRFLGGKPTGAALLLQFLIFIGDGHTVEAERPAAESPQAGAAHRGIRGAGKSYSNPVIADAVLADPTVIFFDDTYYLYATGDTRGYDVYTSTDLVHWSKGARVFRATRPQAWAPDVYRHAADGKFYLYYTTDQKIGVAVAARPDGPFADQGLLVEGAIDAHLFADDDGQLYLYYVQLPGFRIHVQRMTTPLEREGKPLPILEPSQAWEKTHGHVTEGPWMLKHAGRYYLVYSGSGADGPDYAVGYATSSSPGGPFEKYAGNPIIARGPNVFGPGHGCVVRDRDGSLWHVYHQKKYDNIGWSRFVCLDPLWLDEQGVLHGRATRGSSAP